MLPKPFLNVSPSFTQRKIDNSQVQWTLISQILCLWTCLPEKSYSQPPSQYSKCFHSHPWACAGAESLNDLTLTFTAVDAQGCTLPSCFSSYSVEAGLFLVLFSAMFFSFPCFWLVSLHSEWPPDALLKCCLVLQRSRGMGCLLQRKCMYWMHVCVCLLSSSVVSNSLWPHGLQPTRLLCPWDFPRNNTGVGTNSSSRGSSWPRDWTCTSEVSSIADKFFTTSTTWERHAYILSRLYMARNNYFFHACCLSRMRFQWKMVS